MSTKKILLVEDEAILALVMRQKMEEFGHTVVETTNDGTDAVRLALELKPDIIVMDILLANKTNGVDAAEEINAKMTVPIVFVTGQSNRSIVERAKSFSFCKAYLLKPIDFHALKKALDA